MICGNPVTHDALACVCEEWTQLAAKPSPHRRDVCLCVHYQFQRVGSVCLFCFLSCFFLASSFPPIHNPVVNLVVLIAFLSFSFFEDYKKNEHKEVIVDEFLGAEEAKKVLRDSLVSGVHISKWLS